MLPVAVHFPKCVFKSDRVLVKYHTKEKSQERFIVVIKRIYEVLQILKQE